MRSAPIDYWVNWTHYPETKIRVVQGPYGSAFALTGTRPAGTTWMICRTADEGAVLWCRGDGNRVKRCKVLARFCVSGMIKLNYVSFSLWRSQT